MRRLIPLLFEICDRRIQVLRKPQPHGARKIHYSKQANVGCNHGVRKAHGLNDRWASRRTFSLWDIHNDFPRVFAPGISYPQPECPPHIEGRHRRRKVVSPVHGEQHIAGLDTRNVCRTPFKNVQEKPALRSSHWKGPKGCIK